MIKRITPIVLGCLCFLSPLLGSVGDEKRGFKDLKHLAVNTIEAFTGGKETLSAVRKENLRTKVLDQATYDYADAIVADKPVPEDVKKLLRHVISNEEIQNLKQAIIDGISFLSQYSLRPLSLLIKVRPMPPFLKDFFENVTGEEIDRILDPMIQEGSVLESARLYLKRNVHLYKIPNQSDEKIKEGIVSFAKTFMTLKDALNETDSSNIPNRIVATKAELQNIQIINDLFNQYPDKTLVLDMGDADEIQQNDFPKELTMVKNIAVIGKNLTKISDRAFNGCTSLQSIVIPNSVTSIGNEAFSHCMRLQSIVIPNSVTSIDAHAFLGCDNLQSIVIPNSVRLIGTSTFYNCRNLKNVLIPDSVTSIGRYAFFGCTSLQRIVIPDSVTSIDFGAFSRCTSLQSIVIPNSITSIDFATFAGCTSLQSILIPNSVTSIGRFAFSDCTSLQSIVIPDSVTSIDVGAFSNCTSLKSIAIPNSVTSIKVCAFSNCSSLQSIVIPDSVTSIGNNAFNDCTSLKSIVIPDSVTSIGDNAFSSCTSLQSIVVEKDSYAETYIKQQYPDLVQFLVYQ